MCIIIALTFLIGCRREEMTQVEHLAHVNAQD